PLPRCEAEGRPVRLVRLVVEAREHDATGGRARGEMAAYLALDDRKRTLQGKAVRTRGDRGKRDAVGAEVTGEHQRVAVALRQGHVFPRAPAAPDRAYRVDHPARGEVVAGRRL